MTRTAAREIAIQLCFAAASTDQEPGELADRFFDPAYYESLSAEQELFRELPDEKQMAYIRRLTGLVWEKRGEIDELIERYARGWRIERISRTALAVLRCAVCEILYMEDIPNAAAINEAVELCKGYDEPDTVAFVNGVLGGIVRGELGEEPERKSDPAPVEDAPVQE